MANYTGYKNKTLEKKNTYYVGLVLDNSELQALEFSFDEGDVGADEKVLSFDISEDELYNYVLIVSSNGNITLTNINDDFTISLAEGVFTKIQKPCYINGNFYIGNIEIDPMSSEFVLEYGTGTVVGDACKSYRLDNIGNNESLCLTIINQANNNAKILITRM